MLRASLLLAVSVLLLSCGGGGADDDDFSPTPEPIPDFVRATLELIDVSTGADYEGATVTYEGAEEPEVTDANGRVEFDVATLEPFELVATADGFAEYSFQGHVGGDDFLFQSLISPRTVTDSIYGLLGLVADPARGIVVVSLDTPALQAATGGSATLTGVESDAPFIFVNDTPQAGNELIFEAQSFITFPNVSPGTATVEIENPEDDVCLLFPSLDAGVDWDFEVRADTVTVVTFICQ